MKLKILQYAALASTLLLCSSIEAQDCQDNWLSAKGNKIVDINGKEVTLAGINWFGFETANGFPHGVAWSRGMISGLMQIQDLGFNCVRIPWSNENLFGNKTISINADEYRSDPYTGISPLNELESEATTPLELLDVLVKWCQENDMKVILDNHSRKNDGFHSENFWYADGFSTEEWIADWITLAERYKDYSAVVGMDINNEPHNDDFMGIEENFVGALWGTGDEADDWRLAAEACGNAILEVNPNVLILVEGTGAFKDENGISTYWWGGCLKGVEDFPVRLSDPSKLVYSPHEYGPTVYKQDWFFADDFPDNLAGIWEENFNFINSSGTAPLLIGEFGTRDQNSTLGDNEWMETLVQFIKDQGLHYTYWCFNPNSGDTGGILTDDWHTVNQWKMDFLAPILQDPIPNCVAKGILSTEEFNAEVVDFSVYPNPTADVVTFSTSSNNLKSVSLFDLSGKQLQSSDSTHADAKFEFDLSGLQNGIYLAYVVSEKGVTTAVKIIKE